MHNTFQCLYCKTLVTHQNSHHACRKTCGSSVCQAKLSANHMRQAERRKQKHKIQNLKQQGIDLVTCQICQEEFEMIHHAHLKIHGLTVTEYRDKFPNQPILNSRIHQIKAQTSINRFGYLSYNAKPIDLELYEFLTGSLLGDGSIERGSPNRNARYAEGGSNQEYLIWKKSFLENYFPCTFQERLSSPHTKTGKQYRGWWLKTRVHPELSQLHSLWYSSKKVLPKDFIESYLTEFALSIWFYDDGCRANGAFLYTMSFSEDEVRFLSNLLQSRFDLKNSVLCNKSNHFFIRISNYSQGRLFEILQKYPISGMEYKRNQKFS